VAPIVELLQEIGLHLPFPHSSGVEGSRRRHLWELRIQSDGAPLCVVCAFDPTRSAVLLIAGNKTGKDKGFYKAMIPEGGRALWRTPHQPEIPSPAMTRAFSELTKDHSPERRERIEQRKERLRQEMTLAQPLLAPFHSLRTHWPKPQRQAGRYLQHWELGRHADEHPVPFCPGHWDQHLFVSVR
jgi:Phage derived protein Gp49-like (DUF891)